MRGTARSGSSCRSTWILMICRLRQTHSHHHPHLRPRRSAICREWQPSRRWMGPASDHEARSSGQPPTCETVSIFWTLRPESWERPPRTAVNLRPRGVAQPTDDHVPGRSCLLRLIRGPVSPFWRGSGCPACHRRADADSHDLRPKTGQPRGVGGVHGRGSAWPVTAQRTARWTARRTGRRVSGRGWRSWSRWPVGSLGVGDLPFVRSGGASRSDNAT